MCVCVRVRVREGAVVSRLGRSNGTKVEERT